MARKAELEERGLARTWEVTFAMWHKGYEIGGYLREGWEPFAVTESDDGATVWLRRVEEDGGQA